MSNPSPPKAAPEEIRSADALNAAAAANGWPMLCDDTCDFSNPMLGQLLSLWRGEAQDRVPLRQEFNARKLQPFIGNVAILERLSAGAQRRYRVRLMGTAIVKHYGELTGKYLDDAVPENVLPRWYGLCDASLRGEKPFRLLLRADTWDRSHVVAEYLCAPLKADGGGVKFILLGMVFDARRPWTVVEEEARKRLAATNR